MIRGSPRRPERRTASSSAEASRVAATTSVVSNAGLTPSRALVAAAVTSPESRRGAFASPDAASSAIDLAVLAATGAADSSASKVIEAVCAVAVRPSGVALFCCADAGAPDSAARGRVATRLADAAAAFAVDARDGRVSAPAGATSGSATGGVWGTWRDGADVAAAGGSATGLSAAGSTAGAATSATAACGKG